MGMIEIIPPEERKKLFNRPANKRLKYLAMAVGAITIVIQLLILFFIEQLSYQNRLLMEGFVGLFAIIFVSLYGVLMYGVNKEYIHMRR